MKIAINGLSISSGGGVTYLVNLLPVLGRLDKKNQYYILFCRSNADLVPDLPENFHKVIPKFPLESNIARGLYQQLIFPSYLSRQNIDLLYSPADLTSLRAPCPVVTAMRNPNLYTTIHSHWAWPNRLRLNILRRLARRSARKAQKIIFVSSSSLKEITSRLSIDRKKCQAVHHGINPDAFTQGNVKALPHHLPREYLLGISTIYHYKNFLALMEAYLLLYQKRLHQLPPLVIGGGNADKPYYEKMLKFIEHHDLNKKIFLTGKYTYQMIPNLYAGAQAFIFPSYLETFGHPSLEAMAAGVPIAAANIPVMREVLGKASLYFDPHNPNDIAQTLERILTDEHLRTQLREWGLQRVKNFTWEKTAQKTWKIFQQVGNKR